MGGLALTSCNDFLDRSPISDITPEDYFNTVDHGTPEWYEMMRTLTIY